MLLKTQRRALSKLRIEILTKRGLKNGKIEPFSDALYDQLSRHYANCLPISMGIKYLYPSPLPGKCFERSLFMFIALDDAVLVRGKVKDLELRYGKTMAMHGWIEIGDYVYDSMTRMKYESKYYYKIYKVWDVTKHTKPQYCSIGDNQKYYNDIVRTKIDDYRPGGRRRSELYGYVPLLINTARMTKNIQFATDLNNWLDLIQYS